jgi:CHAT domain-containing protein
MPGPLDMSCDLAPGETAVLVLRYPSGALTFHAPQESTRRSRGGGGQARFVVPVRSARSSTSRGLVSAAIKAVLVKVAKAVGDKLVSLALPRLARAFETATWKSKGLEERWLRVTKQTLAAGKLQPGIPISTDRSLLLIHGTFSNAASAYGALASTDFFDQAAGVYADRIFAFDHFTISRTPEENAKMLLAGLPDKRFQFDVVTHSRGGLVLRNLVERTDALGPASNRFNLGRAVLVASPNEGTPLATPARWEATVGWVANLLELFPDNPLSIGAEFVANGLVWIARHASGDLPGIHSMDGDGDLIEELQAPPGPPPESYSALVANYNPTGAVLNVMLDVGADQFFGSANDLVVPAEGGWRIDRSGSLFIPGSRIGCFGPGGNLSPTSVTHLNFFSQQETSRFLLNALAGNAQPLPPVDPAKELPDRRLLRSGSAGVSAPVVRAGRRSPAPKRAHVTGSPDSRELAAKTPPDAIVVTVVNGDLTYEARPLLLGHYRVTRLMGTERIMNTLIGGAMNRSLELGDYAVDPGTHRVFMNRSEVKHKPWLPPRPKAVIVAGLGLEGALRPTDLVHTVRQAVIAWARRLVEQPEPAGESFELAATLVASGGTGVTAAQSAQLVVQGVCEANELLKDQKSGDQQLWPRVSHLRLIELYLDRASDAWRALKMQAAAAPGRYLLTDQIDPGTGPLQRPLESGYRGADYDFITAEARTGPAGETEIAYALDTKRARTEVRSQTTQGRLVRDLVETASSDQNIDPQIGRTLFKLLVPIELEAFLTGSNDMQIVLDEQTAGIPWELLDDGGEDEGKDPNWRPWAIRAKLLRKLQTEKFRERVVDANAESHALVIGEPECPPEYPRLYGAREEALAVYAALTERSALGELKVTKLISDHENEVGSDARSVINTLLERDWRIVHIAGHGAPTAPDGTLGGVVLSNDTFIGASEIKTMRVVPELVCVNCCHLGAFATESVLTGKPKANTYDRARFASNIAQELIDIGVRCVIAAGWAVDDAAASEFAQSFYRALLRGNRFIDAVAQAREDAYKFEGNTWAAYQCYGDPDWRLLRDDDRVTDSGDPPAHEFDIIGSITGLKLALETLQVQTKFQGYEPAYQLKRLANLEQRCKDRNWRGSDGVAELFAQAYAAAGDLKKAIEWYDAADRDADGYVPFKALEQRDNLRVRQAWHDIEAAKRTSSARDPDLLRLLDKARQSIHDALKTFERLIEVEPTAERENLRGSAMKRLSMVEAAAGQPNEAQAAIKDMQRYYRRAQDLVEKSGSSDLFYPASNYIAAELALHAGERGWRGIEPELMTRVRANLAQQNQSDPEFWSIVGEIELDFYEAVGEGKLAEKGPDLERRYVDLYQRMHGGTEWGSVLDTASFVISNYLARASKAEAAAAIALLERLEGFAGTADGKPQGTKKTRAPGAHRPPSRKKASRPGGKRKAAKRRIRR